MSLERAEHSLPINVDGQEPIIQSLLDTDIYKILMQQLMWLEETGAEVTFTVINRDKSVRLCDSIPEEKLRRQLDAAKSLRFSADEIDYLKKATFNGEKDILRPGFLDWLSAFRLPDYRLSTHDVTGDFELSFVGPWAEVTLWEIPALSILSELRSGHVVASLGPDQQTNLYERANQQLSGKIARLDKLEKLGIADFGTRRRHSLAWQRHCLNRMREGLGTRFTGTSNICLAKELGLPPIGTNGHEMPMVFAAMQEGDEALAKAPYHVLDIWQSYYRGNLQIVLPDTFGTSEFLRHAPAWIEGWKGFRPDSKEPVEAGEELIDWWKAHDIDPRDKRLIFSDDLNVERIEMLYQHFHERVGLAFGWGTRLTNDLRTGDDVLDRNLRAVPLVCKVSSVNGRPAVKLSDNPQKISGDPGEVERYIRVFNYPQESSLEE